MPNAIVCKSGIYAITNTVNGKKYIGSSVNIKKRWACHLSTLNNGKHKSTRLQNAWLKYGPDVFVFSVVEVVEDLNRLIEREQHWVDVNGSCGVGGYNARVCADSNLGAKWLPESKARLSLAKTGTSATSKAVAAANAARVLNLAARKVAGVPHHNKGRKKTPEQLQAQGLAQKLAHADRKARGIASPQAGRVTSEETKAKISAACRGKVNSPETRAKMSAWQIGRKLNPESVEKMRLTKIGKKLSQESIAKREATRRANRLAKSNQPTGT